MLLSKLVKARLIAAMLILLPLGMIQSWVVAPLTGNKRTLPRIMTGGLIKVLGIRVNVTGQPDDSRPTIFIANHISAIDSLMLNNIVNGRFMAKKELGEGANLAGKFLRNLLLSCGVIFIDRDRNFSLRTDQAQMAMGLNNGDNIVLFPEGTTSDNSDILRFKRGLLCVAFNAVGRDAVLERDVQIQPIALRLTHLEEQSVEDNPQLRREFAWLDQVDMSKYFLKLAGFRGTRIDVTFFPPLKPEDFKDCNALIKDAHVMIRGAVVGRAPA